MTELAPTLPTWLFFDTNVPQDHLEKGDRAHDVEQLFLKARCRNIRCSLSFTYLAELVAYMKSPSFPWDSWVETAGFLCRHLDGVWPFAPTHGAAFNAITRPYEITDSARASQAIWFRLSTARCFSDLHAYVEIPNESGRAANVQVEALDRFVNERSVAFMKKYYDDIVDSYKPRITKSELFDSYCDRIRNTVSDDTLKMKEFFFLLVDHVHRAAANKRKGLTKKVDMNDLLDAYVTMALAIPTAGVCTNDRNIRTRLTQGGFIGRVRTVEKWLEALA